MKPFIFRRLLPFTGVLVATSCFVPQSVADDPASATGPLKTETGPQDTEASQDKFQMIRYLLEEKHSMIEMFTNHGLLSPAGLQSKIQDINEVTDAHIESLIGQGNRSQWFDAIPEIEIDSRIRAPREKHSLNEDRPVAKRVNVADW